MYFLDSCLKFYQHRTMRADPKMEIMKNVIQEQRMIQYLSYYGNEKCREKRAYVLAATNKIDYITAAIQACGDRVEIISMSPSQGRAAKAYTYDNGGTAVHMLASLDTSFKLWRPVNRLLMHLQLLLYLLRQEKSARILVYHSLGYMKTVAFAKKIRRFHLILEVEEIYGDVTGDAKTVAREMAFFPLADSYIFPTQLLDEKINTAKKPSVIIYGTYKVEADRNCKFDDDEIHRHNKRGIHCVYAGTFDPRKGGAIAAAAAAEYLPDNYHVHVLGFGSDEDVRKMKDLIAEISNRSDAKVTYDGLLSGEDYIRFIQSCDIGLSTQNPDAAFNATSFPSKILSYMANGLRVVSIRIPAIERSAVGNEVMFYNEQTPEAIAAAILKVELGGRDSKAVIEQLDLKFKEELARLIG